MFHRRNHYLSLSSCHPDRRRNVALEEKREDKKRVMKYKRVAELNIEFKKNIELQKSILHEKQSDLDDRVQVIKRLKTSI